MTVDKKDPAKTDSKKPEQTRQEIVNPQSAPASPAPTAQAAAQPGKSASSPAQTASKATNAPETAAAKAPAASTAKPAPVTSTAAAPASKTEPAPTAAAASKVEPTTTTTSKAEPTAAATASKAEPAPTAAAAASKSAAPAETAAKKTAPEPAPAAKPEIDPTKTHTHKDESARGKASRLFLGLKRVPNSRSIVIQNVQPTLDDGRYPIKRVVGDTLTITAEIFREGHDRLKAEILYRPESESEWRHAPMSEDNFGLAHWSGSIALYDNMRYVYTIEAWTDVYESWCNEVEKKLGAEQDVTLELIEGREHINEATARATGADKEWLAAAAKTLEGLDNGGRATLMLGADIRNVMARWPDHSTAIRCDREYQVVVDRVEAQFAAWYEMFLRSQGTVLGQSATFADCEARLPEIKAMGFNVIYFPPHHPIGRTFRKGKNNTLNAGPDDPGSPYAIGSDEGGHKAVNPELGTLEEFRHFAKACKEHGMDVAMDFAVQCSPDHPWIKDNPEWFLFRPDGSIKYAENPPKKYQDIVNVDFYNEHWQSLWEELKSVVEFWIEQGVTIFRVDNPHTKAVPFWEWMIREVQSKHPEAIFLAEAFTRPPMLYMMAKVGFTQSYTYFTWRHTKQELTEFVTEWVETPVKEYARPMFFTNTPDINPPYLQTGGRPAHMIRVVLAATLSSLYGIYNGFELCEATPVPGKEEFLNSEKYEYKVWDWNRDGNIKDYIAKLNWIRGENPALHELYNLRFYKSTDDNILFYGKMTADRSNMIFVAVNLDPFNGRESHIEFPLSEMGLSDWDLYVGEELFTGRRLEWRGSRQWVRLDPYLNPCEIFRIKRLGDIGFGP